MSTKTCIAMPWHNIFTCVALSVCRFTGTIVEEVRVFECLRLAVDWLGFLGLWVNQRPEWAVRENAKPRHSLIERIGLTHAACAPLEVISLFATYSVLALKSKLPDRLPIVTTCVTLEFLELELPLSEAFVPGDFFMPWDLHAIATKMKANECSF